MLFTRKDGGFSMAMLVYRRVLRQKNKHPKSTSSSKPKKNPTMGFKYLGIQDIYLRKHEGAVKFTINRPKIEKKKEGNTEKHTNI